LEQTQSHPQHHRPPAAAAARTLLLATEGLLKQAEQIDGLAGLKVMMIMMM